MTFIDTNLTYSKQVCDLAIGGLAGIGGSLYVLANLLFFLLAFYLVYRVTEIFIRKYKLDKTTQDNSKSKIVRRSIHK